jgi:hypothetical protein
MPMSYKKKRKEIKRLKCPKCGKDIMEVTDSRGGKDHVLDEQSTLLYTLADDQVFGEVYGYQPHRCKPKTRRRQ